MKIGDVLMLFAVLLSPVIAVQIQVWLEVFREKRSRKLSVLQTLMATRTIAARVSPEHVRALNMIDLTFYGGRIWLISLRTKAEKLVLRAEIHRSPLKLSTHRLAMARGRQPLRARAK
jgi:hypothetical protein